MNTETMEQGGAEWQAIRLGKVTASRVADLTAKTKTGYGASRANYMAQIICERMTGAAQESYTNAAMQWGVEKEPDARAAYEFMHNVDVQQVGFVHHPTIQMAGCSPDGLIGTDGLIEIKAPQTATHIETLLSQTVPGKYQTQMQFQMACTGRQYCDFVSYDPRMSPDLQLWVKRVPRDEEAIAVQEKEVIAFLKEVEEKIARLNALASHREAA